MLRSSIDITIDDLNNSIPPDFMQQYFIGHMQLKTIEGSQMIEPTEDAVRASNNKLQLLRDIRNC